jgi:hypothetical protein
VKARALVEKETLKFTLQEKKEHCKKKAFSLESLLKTCKINFFTASHHVFRLNIFLPTNRKGYSKILTLLEQRSFYHCYNFRAKW